MEEEERRLRRKNGGKSLISGDYVLLKKRKKEYAEASLRAAEALEIKHSVDPDIRAIEWVPGTGQVPIPNEEELVRKLGDELAEKLRSIMREQSNTLKKIANKSRNLHGTYVRLLRMAAASAEVVASILVTRIKMMGNSDKLQEAHLYLMKKVRDLSNENEMLRQGTVGSVGASLMPSPQPGACSTPQNRSQSNTLVVEDEQEVESRKCRGRGEDEGMRAGRKEKEEMMEKLEGVIEKKFKNIRQELIEILRPVTKGIENKRTEIKLLARKARPEGRGEALSRDSPRD